ncbi:hypothetical protein T552_02962 [Pneumocystis carinii B80]|uniref:Actin-related protein 4 n=1 Tax=Pneumocystis carinii (strain B80) TaxID=1408658 RepID=A0A0W4ZDN3_PNEC8|nr:hypothetical protein T552_02962 [Pneumocystis carinii B80]KTW26481.1 hypothetical protein T552_02962 [Pneumocystis carinii B80]
MTTQIYGGDEISAIVLDPGSQHTRAGYAGEDTPKCVIESSYGLLVENNNSEIVFGDNSIHAPRAGMEIKNPMLDGIVHDWDIVSKIWLYAIKTSLRVDPTEHPLLVTEPSWNPPKNREKTMEIVFEKFGSPAFYLAKNAVCASFANGKSTALILDVGAQVASVTPIYDGLVLKRGVMKQNIAGNYLSAQARAYFSRANIPIVPHYMVKKKVPVDIEAPSRAELRKFSNICESFHVFQQDRVMQEFKESICQVFEKSLSESIPSSRPAKAFEFPDGYNLLIDIDRYKVPEVLFNPSFLATESPEIIPPENSISLAQLLYNSAMACDTDIRATLLGNIIITGGTSLIQGFGDRILTELQLLAPGSRIKINASGNTVERKYASWLGGSILASLGTFHQLWISKKEYDEEGDRASLIEKRCK